MPRYRVYADYIMTKILGEVEAESKEEAIEKLMDRADPQAGLCYQCQEDFVDDAMLMDDGFDAEEIK